IVRGPEAATAPEHGTVIGEGTSLSTVDKNPVVARAQPYTVFASAHRRTWARPARGRCGVVPPISAPIPRADPQRVTGTWTVHQDAVSVTVRRGELRAPSSTGDGRSIAVSSRTSFVDDHVRQGVEYFYLIAAVYRDERGREVESAAVVAA